MAMAGMAGTAVGVAIAVLKEKADRRSLRQEIEEDEAAAMERGESTPDEDEKQQDETVPPGEDETKDG